MLFTVNRLGGDCLKVVEKINSLKDQLQFITSGQRNRWSGLMYKSALAKAIQGSNSIEGYNVTYEDAVAVVDGEEPVTAEKETVFATQGLNSAMTHILQVAKDPSFVLDEGTIRGLHFMMVQHDINKHPGTWRPGPIFVIHEPDGETVYTGPDVKLVLPLMREFLKSLTEPSDLPVQVRAALAHLNLVMIHPFSDGNGRMGRALQTLMLARERIVDPVFSSIENYIWKHSEDYYKVLGEVGQGSWHPENDPIPFIKFCLIAHYREAEKLLYTAQRSILIWNALDQLLKEKKLPERLMLALGSAVFRMRVRNPSYREKANISEEAALKDLKTLVHEGLLIPMGEKRGRYYLAGEVLDQIYKKYTPLHVETDPFLELQRSQQPDFPGMSPVET